ncbi:hypothetical protein Tco_0905186, partial [Tanacetum coccineum]
VPWVRGHGSATLGQRFSSPNTPERRFSYLREFSEGVSWMVQVRFRGFTIRFRGFWVSELLQRVSKPEGSEDEGVADSDLGFSGLALGSSTSVTVVVSDG